MPKQDGGGEVVVPSEEELFRCLHAVFDPFDAGDSPEELQNASAAILNLVGFNLQRINAKLLKTRNAVCVDCFGLGEALLRFQRDAFGLQRCRNRLDKLGLTTPQTESVMSEIKRLGVRINSETPWKTRIAADFTLWMTTFRPFHIRPDCAREFRTDYLVQFNACLTLWIAIMYLRMFGKVNFGDDADAVNFIKYDFTYRNLTLSSLETFFRAIYSSNSTI